MATNTWKWDKTHKFRRLSVSVHHQRCLLCLFCRGRKELVWLGSPDHEREPMQHGLCFSSCRLSSEHTSRLRGDCRIEKGRLEGTGPHPLRPRSDIGARSGGCLSQKTSALHPGHEQHEERGAAVANEVRGTILRVKYLVYFTTHETAPLGATKSMKVDDQQ